MQLLNFTVESWWLIFDDSMYCRGAFGKDKWLRSYPKVVRIRLPSLEWIEEQQGEMICHSFLRNVCWKLFSLCFYSSFSSIFWMMLFLSVTVLLVQCNLIVYKSKMGLTSCQNTEERTKGRSQVIYRDTVPLMVLLLLYQHYTYSL